MNQNKKKNKNINSIILAVALLSVSNVYAEFDPGVIKAGGVDIIPILGISESYNSNILYVESDEKSSMVTTIKPEVSAIMEMGANKYSIAAGASIGRYSESSADDYVDSNLSFDLHQSFTRKSTLDVKAERLNIHEDRGIGYSQGSTTLPPEPDEYHINQLEGEFSYGSKDAVGRIVLRAFSENRVYDNHRSTTKGRDRDNVGGGITFYYHIMPKTALLFELDHRELVYINSDNYDTVEQRALVGASWDISALTTGTAKAGLLEKSFDAALLKDTSIFSWEIGARWTPLSYSVLDLITKGSLEESNDANADYIESKTVLLKWTHFWNETLDTVLDLNVTNNDYQPSSREDDFVSFGLRANYNMRRWLNVGLGYVRSSNQSTQAGLDYSKNVFTLSLVAAL